MLIDLDAAPAATARPRRNLRYGLIVAAALLLVLGGAAPPAHGAGLVAVVSTDGYAATSNLLTEHALYTVHRSRRERSTVRARPLHPGGPRWSVEVSGDELTLRAAGDVLVVTTPEEVTFLDAASGLLRWRAGEGALVRLLGDRVAVATANRLRAADLHTGRTLWSRAIGEFYGLDAGARHVVTLDYPRAEASVYDAATGRELAARVPLGTDPDLFGMEFPELFAETAVVGDRLYVYGTGELRAFRLADLSPLGSVRPAAPVLGVRACGDHLCATGPGGLAVFEPALGTPGWSDGRWTGVTADGVVFADDGRTAQIDLATGRVLRELGRGGPAGDLMLRVEADRTWVTGLGDGRVLGVIPSVAARRCTAAGDYLACPTTGATVTVWRAVRS